jgi:hypothetical protein
VEAALTLLWSAKTYETGRRTAVSFHLFCMAGIRLYKLDRRIPWRAYSNRINSR